MTNDQTRAAIEELKEPLVEAVINAYMRKKLPADVDNLYFDASDHRGGSCVTGQFRYKIPRAFGDKGVYCSYPSGEWRVDHSLAADPAVSSGERIIEGERVLLPDLVPMWAEIRNEVTSWIDPWQKGVDPDAFSEAIADLAVVAEQLHIGDVRTNAAAGGGGTVTTLSPVSDIQTAVDDCISDLSLMSGRAVRSLQRAYTNDVARTLSGQRNLATVATLALVAEVTAWTECYETLLRFLTAATSDFTNYAFSATGSAPSSTAVLLTALSGTSTVVAGFATFPPAAAAATALAGIAAVTAAFWPTIHHPASKETLVSLEGSDLTALLDSFTATIKTIEDDLFDAEHAVAQMCTAALDDSIRNPDSYSIARTLPSGDPQPGDPLGAFLRSEDDLGIIPRAMRDVAGRIQTISRHQRTLARRLHHDHGVLDTAAWTRSALHGDSIGMVDQGAYDEYAALVNHLIDLLRDEGRTAHDVALQCLDLATDFERVDDSRSAELTRLNHRLDDLEARHNTVDAPDWRFTNHG